MAEGNLGALAPPSTVASPNLLLWLDPLPWLPTLFLRCSQLTAPSTPGRPPSGLHSLSQRPSVLGNSPSPLSLASTHHILIQQTLIEPCTRSSFPPLKFSLSTTVPGGAFCTLHGADSAIPPHTLPGRATGPAGGSLQSSGATHRMSCHRHRGERPACCRLFCGWGPW